MISISVGSIVGHRPPKDRKVFNKSNPFYLPDQLIGIELEYNKVNSDQRLTYWNVIKDGSLRDHGKEFVLKEPLCGDKLWRAISLLFKHVRIHEFQIDLETSCHIHMDVRHLQPVELSKLLLTLMLYEDLLYVNKYRVASGFCKKVTNNGVYINQLIDIIKKLPIVDGPSAYRLLKKFHDDRYYSFAIDSIIRFGSVEFRTFQAPKNKEELVEYINLVQGFMRVTFELPDSFTDAFRDLMNVDWVLSHFPNSVIALVNKGELRESILDRGGYI